MRVERFALVLSCVAVAACGGGNASAPPTPSVTPAGSLSGIAAEHLVLLPTYRLNVANDVAFVNDIESARGVLAAFDSMFARALDDRSIGRGWVMPPQLVRDYRRNPTYATDPYALAEEPLRAPKFPADAKLPDPFASQLRTIVAIGDARFVLAPVEVKLVRSASDSTRATPWLRLVLIDARADEVKWAGDVSGDPIATWSPASLRSLATHAAELFTTP